ncbi:MAG TPA: glycosyltransferase family 39 protein [Pyrinomonadaceae bacterium]
MQYPRAGSLSLFKSKSVALLDEVRLLIESSPNAFFILISTLVGFVALWHVTRSGICIITDSSYYLMVSESLVKYHAFATFTPDGHIKPLTVWPPLYPSLLSLFRLISISPAAAARWINAILFGLNASLAGLLVKRVSRGGLIVAAACALLFLSSTSMLSLHWVALSEPLFIFFLLACLYSLCGYLENKRLGWLLAAACAASMAWLTRYSGISFVAAGTLAVLLLSDLKRARRIVHAALFSLTASIPNLLWMVRNQIVAGTASGKHFGWHPATLSLFQDYLITIARFILPEGMIPATVTALALLGLLLLLALSWRRGHLKLSLNRAQKLLLLFAAAYSALLYISISFLDANLVIDTWRLSLPICLIGFILALSFVQRLFASGGGNALNRRSRQAATACAILFLCAFTFRGAQWISTSDSGESKNVESSNFTSRYWTESSLIQALKELPPDTPIYTNGPDALYVLTGRPAYPLPQKFNVETLQASASYEESLQAIGDKLKDGGVVVFLYTHRFANLPTQQELLEKLALEEVFKDTTGKIFAKGR